MGEVATKPSGEMAAGKAALPGSLLVLGVPRQSVLSGAEVLWADDPQPATGIQLNFFTYAGARGMVVIFCLAGKRLERRV
jgi:hypothetical protein